MNVVSYLFVATLVASIIPLVLRKAGGIEKGLDRFVLAAWVGVYTNFVLRCALLLRHESAGHLSPLSYIGLASISNTIFLMVDNESSRLWVTLAALAIAKAQSVSLRALYSGLFVPVVARPGAHEMDNV